MSTSTEQHKQVKGGESKEEPTVLVKERYIHYTERETHMQSQRERERKKGREREKVVRLCVSVTSGYAVDPHTSSLAPTFSWSTLSVHTYLSFSFRYLAHALVICEETRS